VSTPTDDIDATRLRELVERIESVDAQIREHLETRKELYIEARAEGFDHKAIKWLIRQRRIPHEQLELFEDTLAKYRRALRDE
jgi:uncharacterized protein (UPF0335 family)